MHLYTDYVVIRGAVMAFFGDIDPDIAASRLALKTLARVTHQTVTVVTGTLLSRISSAPTVKVSQRSCSTE